MIRRFGTFYLAIAFACVCVPCLRAQGQQPHSAPKAIAIRAARLIVGRAAKGSPAQAESIIADAVVIVEGEKITAVGSRLAIPSGATVIDLGDATLLPGLIDAHTHLLMELDGTNSSLGDAAMVKAVIMESTADRALLGAKLGREDLEAGITTVRDLGNSGVNGDVALRDAINRGWVPGPRIIAATRALAAPGGQFPRLNPDAQSIIEQEYVTIDGPESARQAVRKALYNGADCIKVIVNGNPANVTLDEMKAIVEEAHINDVKVAAHATDEKAIRIAVEAGADSIEHGYVISDDLLKTMAQKHIFLVPTDGTVQQYVDINLGDRQPTPDERKEMEKGTKEYVAGNGDRLRRAIKFGVPIAAGSDMFAIVPHKNRGQATLDMLAAYADEGMTPLEIIHAATSNAAELLGWQDRIGALEVGKFADIIAVPGDPLKDANALQHAKFVMKGGVVIKNER